MPALEIIDARIQQVDPVTKVTRKVFDNGVELEAGRIIPGGSFTAPVRARPGGVFHVDYGQLDPIACRGR